jgi:hypothetical protein
LFARVFPKENKKGIVAIVTGDEKRMNILIITEWKQVMRTITEKLIPRRFVAERKRKKS